MHEALLPSGVFVFDAASNDREYMSLLHGAGLVLTSLEERGPSPEQIAEVPARAVERDRPPFLLVRCGS